LLKAQLYHGLRFRQAKKRFTACLRFLSLVRPSIGKTLAFDALKQSFGAHVVAHTKRGTMVEPKFKLSHVTLQVLFLAFVIGADHAAFEDAKESLGGVGGLPIGADRF